MPARRACVVTSSVLATRTVGDGWSRSGVVGGGGGGRVGRGVVLGKHVLLRGGDPEVRPVEDNEDSRLYGYNLVEPMFPK